MNKEETNIQGNDVKLTIIKKSTSLPMSFSNYLVTKNVLWFWLVLSLSPYGHCINTCNARKHISIFIVSFLFWPCLSNSSYPGSP